MPTISRPQPLLAIPAGDQVDLWLIAASVSDQLDSRLLPNPVEVERCEQFVIPRRRSQYIFAHLSLHRVLQAYLGVYTLLRNHQGKPFIANTCSGLEFSMSHAESLCAIAISMQDVGIDIEVASPRIAHAELMEHYFPDYRLPQTGSGQWGSQRAGIVAWCHFESSIKLEGETLHEHLWNSVSRPWYKRSHSHLALLGEEYVCVVAQRQPFCLSRVWKVPFSADTFAVHPYQSGQEMMHEVTTNNH